MPDKKFEARQKKAVKLLQEVGAEKKPMSAAHIVEDYDGIKYQSFTNGFMGFMLKEEMPDLMFMEPLNMVKVIRENESKLRYEDTLVYRPSLKEIKEYIKIKKAENKDKLIQDDIIYQIGNHYYNAQYLVDVFEVLGGNIEMIQDETKPTTPGIFTSENGKAILLPIKPLR